MCRETRKFIDIINRLKNVMLLFCEQKMKNYFSKNN